MEKNHSNYTVLNFLKSTKIYFVGRLVQSASFFLLLIILLRSMSEIDYGAYMTLLGLIEFLVPLTSFGLIEVIRRYIPDVSENSTTKHLKELIYKVLAIRILFLVIFSLLVYELWDYIVALINYEKSHSSEKLLILWVLFSTLLFRFTAEILECLFAQTYTQIARIVFILGQVLSVVIFYYVYSDIQFIDILKIISLFTTISLLLTFLFILIVVSEHKTENLEPIGISNIVTFSWHVTGSSLLQTFASDGFVRLVVANQLGLETAGVFGFLHQLTSVASRYLPSNFLINVIRPMLVTRYALSGDINVLRSSLGIMWKSNILIITLYILCSYLLGDLFLTRISDDKIQQAGVLLSTLFFLLYTTSQRQLLEMTLQIIERTKELRNFSLILPVLPILVWLGTNFNLQGVVISLIVFSWVWNYIVLNYMASSLDFELINITHNMRLFSTLLILVVVVMLLQRLFSIYTATTLALLLYIVAIIYSKPITDSEYKLLDSVLKKNKSKSFRKLIRLCSS
ncbi:MAG: hypothetical protein JAY63_01055 [Candidatus Thiodiazotropha taylori]|nr:hypothetical protein [Candidatus Thiodiazotropha taylori]